MGLRKKLLVYTLEIKSAFGLYRFYRFYISVLITGEVKTIIGILAIEDFLKLENPLARIVRYSSRPIPNETYFAITGRKTLLETLTSKNLDSINGWVVFEGKRCFKTGLITGYYYLFMCYFAFNVDYNPKYEEILVFIERFLMKWRITEELPEKLQNIAFNFI